MTKKNVDGTLLGCLDMAAHNSIVNPMAVEHVGFFLKAGKDDFTARMNRLRNVLEIVLKQASKIKEVVEKRGYKDVLDLFTEKIAEIDVL